MTLLYYDPLFLHHRTGSHPENPGRILPVIRHLNFVALDTACSRPTWQDVSREQLMYAHSQDYIDAVREFAEHGGGWIEEDTVVCDESYAVAIRAVGAVCDATVRVVQGEGNSAFCLVRPPGHHALADRAMGFCLFNNVAVGARVAIRDLGIERVLIIDWDVHHGNGTQAIFWEDAQVGYFSMHRSPFYPGTGHADEIGSGAGLGTTCNVPVDFGTSREDQLQQFADQLTRFADKIRPQLVMISAGFDSHKDDPIGSLGLESEDFTTLTKIVQNVANTHAQGRIVSVLEGGYNPDALTECVECHLQQLLEQHDE